MRTLLIAVLLSTIARESLAQDPALPSPPSDSLGPACSDEAFRQFDFWIGQWRVGRPGTVPRATNEITRVAHGCALQERYAHDGGYSGTSLNFFEPPTEGWTQLWVDSEGLVLRLHGGLDSRGRMVLYGERLEPTGNEIRDRITWIPVAADTVHQIWDVSRDDGLTWDNLFTGQYVRASTE